ncbi:unnamed protein product [Prorocentrum cordatum]|uniref:Uncharacterized protein n=1 Tax=Prorocentrum cordatum TaxID=2364126 RepID=A0ABN9RQK0_9DINO|nr:unnamed protein product [Polarella glacialis]
MAVWGPVAVRLRACPVPPPGGPGRPADLGGRSWLVVNAMATDPGDWTLQDGVVVAGRFNVGEKALMDVVVPDGKWAGKFAPAWADWAKSVGCSGIHWSSMGDYNGSIGKGADFSGFLQASHQIVKDKGLGQIANFADGFGWNATLVQRRIIAFPYWVVFTVPEQEDRFFNETPKGSVLVLYPGESADHGEEPWNRFVRGVSPLDVLVLRWQRARCHGDSYLAVGDGSKRVTSDYTPMASEMSPDEIAKVRKMVFGRYTCEDGNVMHAEDFESTTRGNATEGTDIPAADTEAKSKHNGTEAAERGAGARFLDKKRSHGGAPGAAGEAESERHVQRGRLTIQLGGGRGSIDGIEQVVEATVRDAFGYEAVTLSVVDRALSDAHASGEAYELSFAAACGAPCPPTGPPRSTSDVVLAGAIERAASSAGASVMVKAARFRIDEGEDASRVAGGAPPQVTATDAVTEDPQVRKASDVINSDVPAQSALAAAGAGTRASGAGADESPSAQAWQASRGRPPSGFWLGVPVLVGAFAALTGACFSRSGRPTPARPPPAAAGGPPGAAGAAGRSGASGAATDWAYRMSARPCRPSGDVDY